jgi:hypothetical protein
MLRLPVPVEPVQIDFLTDAGVSYSVPINPHVAAAHATGVSILTEIFYCLQAFPCPPASGTIQL